MKIHQNCFITFLSLLKVSYKTFVTHTFGLAYICISCNKLYVCNCSSFLLKCFFLRKHKFTTKTYLLLLNALFTGLNASFKQKPRLTFDEAQSLNTLGCCLNLSMESKQRCVWDEKNFTKLQCIRNSTIYKHLPLPIVQGVLEINSNKK